MEIIKPKSDVNLNDVKHFTNRIHVDKQKILDESFKEVRSLSRDLENLKLQNEELEITIKGLLKENENSQDSYELLKKSYGTLSQKYKETRDLLQTSHNQNLELSKVIDKIRQNEKCLMEELHKSRRVGSTGNFSNLQLNVSNCTIESLEREVSFWQKEAEKLTQIISLQDLSPKVLKDKSGNHKKNNKKNANHSQRYNKVVVRSHSMENAQRKTKELEFSKLKMEKEQMKNLLSNLEYQIAEIQNNVVKINNEKEKYKDSFYEKKEKLDKSDILLSELDKQLNAVVTTNSRITHENEKYSDNINILITDNKRCQLLNQNLVKELSDAKSRYSREMESRDSKIDVLIKENNELGTRSNNLKDNIDSMELEFSNLEQELRNKVLQIKEQSDFIDNLKVQMDKVQSELKDNSEQLNISHEKIKDFQKNNRDLIKCEENLQSELETKSKDSNTMKLKLKDKDDEISKLKSSFSAQIIKFESHLQNADHIISSKIKLISSLEMKLANYDRDLKLKDEELLQLKREFNTKIHEYDVLAHKYDESKTAQKYLQQHIDNICANNNNNSREILELNQTISDLSNTLEKLKDEFLLQREIIDEKDKQIVMIDNGKKELKEDIVLKDDEIIRNKRLICQLRADIEQREGHLGSLLEVIEEKENRLAASQCEIFENGKKIKDYADQLANYDDSMIQSSSRTDALEKEIEGLRNANMRLTRQKEQISQSLSARNKELGHLQVKMENRENGFSSTRYSAFNAPVKRNGISYKNAEEEIYGLQADTDHFRYEANDRNVYLETKNRDNHKFRSVNILAPTKIQTSIAENYDPMAVRNRAHSYDGRQLRSVDCF